MRTIESIRVRGWLARSACLSRVAPRPGSGGRRYTPGVAFPCDQNGRTTSSSSDQDQWCHDAVRGDDGASPVLAAVVNEFAKKGEKAAQSQDVRVAVIELEQAGDSAKVAVEADPGVSPATRDAVLEAHLAICIAKSKLDL